MHVVEQERAAAYAADDVAQLGGAGAAGGGRGESLEQPRLVALGLQSPHEPGASVGERLVVEVHGVLRGQREPHPVRPRLLQEGHERLLGGRLGHGRQETEQLVDVDEGPQAARAALRARPGHHLGEQQAEEEAALRVAEVSDGDHRHARSAVRTVQQALHVERLTPGPGVEGGGGHERVDGQRQLHAVLGGEDRLYVHHAQALDGRVLHRVYEVRQRQVAALTPGVLQDAAEEDLLAR